MVSFQKKALSCKSRKEKFVFEKFDVRAAEKSGVWSAVSAKNCDCISGALKAGAGLERFTLENGENLSLSVSSDMDSVFLWNMSKGDGTYVPAVGVISKKGSVRLFNLTIGTWTALCVCATRVRALSAMDLTGVNWLILYGEVGGYACSTLGSLKQIYPYAVTGACVCGGRLFLASENEKIVYSKPYEPTNFVFSIDDGGAVSLPTDLGKIVGLVPFQNDVCVLYEYGLGKLEIKGSAREFRFEKIGYGGGKIFGDSAGVCSVGGEKLFFLAESGVYSFDGKRVEACCKNLEIQPIGDTQVCNHAEFDGKYFVRFTGKDGVGKGVVVDAESGKGYEAFAPLALSSSQGQALCLADEYVQRIKSFGLLPSGEYFEFHVKKERFGSDKKKLLRALRFFGKGTLEICVGNGLKSKTKTIELIDGQAELPIGLLGVEFSVSLRLQPGAEISKIEARTETFSGFGA